MQNLFLLIARDPEQDASYVLVTERSVEELVKDYDLVSAFTIVSVCGAQDILGSLVFVVDGTVKLDRRIK